MSVATMRRYMHASNIRNYVAVSKPFLSKRNILARVEWAKLHRTFDANRWDTVAFSDESSFTVRPTTLRKRVWRTSGTRFNNENLVPTFKSGFVSISVWAAFSARGRTPLIRINGTLNKEKYQTILESVLKPFIQKYHAGNNQFIFQQDGCGLHRAKSIKACIDANRINLMNRPAQSPDLNPIENV